mgnify:CR=1 FL=1
MFLAPARAFASALDRDDFATARPFLSSRCVYEVRGSVLEGPDAILASYENATRDARAQFDEVFYESEVEATATGARIHYTDIVRRNGREHRHRCVQHLTFAADEKITRIVHEDLPGEREAVRAFLADCGEAAHQ